MNRVMASVLACVFASLPALAGPPGDYGDAPVGNNGDGINAYPGVVARWTTAFAHKSTVFSPYHPQGAWLNPGATARLGTVGPAVKFDSAMTPGPPENDGAPVILIWPDGPNPGPNPLCSLEITVTTSAGHDPTQPVYLNIWVDQNRDGQWKDGYNVATPLAAWNLEWLAQDVSVMMPAGTTARVSIAPIRLEDPLNTHWLRAMVSKEPVGAAFRGPYGQLSGLWDSSMTAAHPFRGEIEDHFLTFRTDDPGPVPTPGVWYYRHYKKKNPPGGGPPPKPACILTYEGPWTVYPPICAARLITTLRYGHFSINNGCDMAPALWGMYGLKHIAGVMAPPTVNVRLPLPVGAIPGVVAMPCPAPFLGALALAAAVPGEGPLMESLQIPVRRLTDPPSLRIESCYGRPPRRFRVYRAFFHHDTCGSLHISRSVHTHPATGMTVSSVVSDGSGQGSDYCDFVTGGLEENIEDPGEGRPFPDPDFADAIITIYTPTGSVVPFPDDFTSAPLSLSVRGAAYLVTPAIPDGYRAGRFLMNHRGDLATVVFTAVDGAVLVMTLPPTPAWSQVEMTMPEGFELDSFEIQSPAALVVDDIRVSLRPASPCREVSPVDWTRSAQAGTDALFDVNFFGPGSEPFFPYPPFPSITWQLWRGGDHPLLTSDDDASALWMPLTDGMLLPGGTQVVFTPDGDLQLLNLGAADFINREIRVRTTPMSDCPTQDLYSMAMDLVGCNLADITEIGGTLEIPGNPDNLLTLDDILLFVDAYNDSTGCPGEVPCNLADVTDIGDSGAGPDGQLTLDDILAFIDAYNAGCDE